MLECPHLPGVLEVNPPALDGVLHGLNLLLDHGVKEPHEPKPSRLPCVMLLLHLQRLIHLQVTYMYMYTHSIHLSVCGPPCAIICLLLQNGKWLLGASISHAHSEALLRATSAVSMVTIEVALVTLKSKMSATKLPSCVTMKT